MDLFAVIGTGEGDATRLGNAVTTTYPNSLIIAPNVWLVAEKGLTSKEICDKMGVSPAGINNTVVLKFDAYYGVASRNIWEWLAVKGAEP